MDYEYSNPILPDVEYDTHEEAQLICDQLREGTYTLDVDKISDKQLRESVIAQRAAKTVKEAIKNG